MSKVFLFDVAKCNGCYNCQIACKDEHCGTDWLPYAAAQPETGQFWMRLVEKERGQIPVVSVAYTATMCAHCADAPCAAACASDAFERREDGLLLINPEKCSGCGACVDACELGAIFFNKESNIAQKCTGCAHLLDNGWDVPRCVDICSHDAIRYVEESEVADELAKAEALPAVAGNGPKAFYLNLPKRFVAGVAVDLTADEVVIGAKVTLKNGDEVVAEMDTDYMGDFKFNQVEPAVYTVIVEAEGYKTVTATADVTEIDRYIGVLDMQQ